MKEPSIDGPKRDLHSLNNRLLRYVIATCYPKMIRRLGNKNWSQPYIESLKGVTTFQFDESRLHRDQVSRKEIANDRQFLLTFFLPTSSVLKTDAPKLLEKAKAAKDSEDIQFYTKDTCEEFHQLLLEVLISFEKSLENLNTARGNPEVPTQGSDDFKKKVDLVILYGYALERLTKGAALKMHLITISHLLNRTHRRSMAMPASGEEQTELDEDLEAVQPSVTVEGTSMPPLISTSYIDWMKLMIVHFDAVNILVGYVTGTDFKYDTISIQILVAPPEDDRLLPWKDLILDSTLFPPEPDNAGISNVEIFGILNNAIKYSEKVKGAKTSWGKRNLKNTIAFVEALKDSPLPSWSNHATKLLVKLRSLEEKKKATDGAKSRPWANSKPHKRSLDDLGRVASGNDDLIDEITKDLQSLSESAQFITFLNEKKKITGTLHCEACLASLLALLFGGVTTVSEKILAQMIVGYVSDFFYH